MKQLSPTHGNIGPVRFSYMNVFKPKMNDLRKELQYSAILLIPKSAREFCPNPDAEIKGVAEMIKAAAAAKFGESIKKYDVPFKDGDIETNAEGDAKHPGYWFLKVSSGIDYPPKLIDGKRQEVTTGWESGDWGIAQVSFKAYDYEGKKGVGAYLRAVQFLYVDEHFGSSVSADDFDEVEDATVKTPISSGSYDPFSDE